MKIPTRGKQSEQDTRLRRLILRPFQAFLQAEIVVG
jgi:hypothetical protein